ncbi:hypothetical protein [Saccharothrix sp. NRRL B-16348]|uniref:hypothetical protein n=1 Tax=Saccharothrix sp. NRRL B-16348 TaxID=1415542 RepID=UPI0012FB0C72|nr:hypothetical protein [Saccharothrix sp. NRRL B-16348]
MNPDSILGINPPRHTRMSRPSLKLFNAAHAERLRGLFERGVRRAAADGDGAGDAVDRRGRRGTRVGRDRVADQLAGHGEDAKVLRFAAAVDQAADARRPPRYLPG